MSLLDQHRRELGRARDRKIALTKDVQSITRKIALKRPQVAKAQTDTTRRSRQREVERLESSLVKAQDRVAAQEKTITTLQAKIAREEAAATRQQQRAEQRRRQQQERRDQEIEQDLVALQDSTSDLHSRLDAVEAAALASLADAISADPVQRAHDVFLSYATPDESGAGQLRDELVARGLDVWMADAGVVLGESLVTGIDHGISTAKCGICFVTSAYIDPDRVWPRQELAALIMGRKRVIPVLAGLSFDDLQGFSALLGDRKGLSTAGHGLDEIAELIADSLVGKLRRSTTQVT